MASREVTSFSGRNRFFANHITSVSGLSSRYSVNTTRLFPSLLNHRSTNFFPLGRMSLNFLVLYFSFSRSRQECSAGHDGSNWSRNTGIQKILVACYYSRLFREAFIPCPDNPEGCGFNFGY